MWLVISDHLIAYADGPVLAWVSTLMGQLFALDNPQIVTLGQMVTLFTLDNPHPQSLRITTLEIRGPKDAKDYRSQDLRGGAATSGL